MMRSRLLSWLRNLSGLWGAGRSALSRCAGRGLGGFIAHRLFAGKLDAALIVDGDDLHADGLAELHFFANGLEEAVGEFGNVAQPILSGDDFDEGAEILNAGDLAGVDLAD